MLQMKRIPVPEWARPFVVSVSEDFGEAFDQFSACRDDIMEIVQMFIENFINDDEFVSGEGNHLFPERKKLTGEYYISEENYSVYQKQNERNPRYHPERQYRLSIMARCLEKQWIDNQTDFDYLGLELYFLWEPTKQNFYYTGDIEPSSI